LREADAQPNLGVQPDAPISGVPLGRLVAGAPLTDHVFALMHLTGC
jgi:hypothetical protein